jgi:hypothetical protein
MKLLGLVALCFACSLGLSAHATDFSYDFGDVAKTGPAVGSDRTHTAFVSLPLNPNDRVKFTFEYGGGVTLVGAFYDFEFIDFYREYDEYCGSQPGCGDEVPNPRFCAGLACFDQSDAGVLTAVISTPTNRGDVSDCAGPPVGVTTHCIDRYRTTPGEFDFFFQVSGTPDPTNPDLLHCPDCYARLTVESVSDVPEPGSWALMMVGFGALGTILRRRRQTTRLLAS